jgi:zinc metalloprotease ZmpB
VISSQSSRHADLDVKQPSKDAMERLKKITKTKLSRILGLLPKQKEFDTKTLAIDQLQPIIYRYVEARRTIAKGPSEETDRLSHPPMTLPLPSVDKSIQEGKHYVSAEVHFSLTPPGMSELHWVAIVEAETLSVLYLRAFIDHVNGLVFQNEPMTDNGGPMPNATNAQLNPVRTSMLLEGLLPPSGGVQSLIGNKVKVVDFELPTVTPPTRPVGTNFDIFDARTNDFAAVNAYYHCNQFFQMVQSMGFNLASYFGSATVFPSQVDHRGCQGPKCLNGNCINAHCLGTSGGKGILGTGFALADSTDIAHPLGIATDYRVVLHELGGHGVLYPHVSSPNFGFSHSAGDSVAAITCDPNSHAYNSVNPSDPKRFVTFPWVDIGRRHDRSVSSGWGWSGNIALHPFDYNLDYGGYNNEQILSTTLFRFYRSIRGDSPQLAERQFAARYVVYLILRAIGMLTPAMNPSNAAGFATALMNADLGDWTTEGHAGGAYGKVIRWAFEKQGVYQPAGTIIPNNDIGAPPAVDVYIEDGRHGEYQYNPVWYYCQAIWNRRQPGGTTHEEPIVNVTNYAYVKIKNRGTQVAKDVVVKAYHAKPGMGLVYPNDWQPMTTAQLKAPNVPPNSSVEITVGPFEWTPSQIGHECMFMVVSAGGDSSNISNMTTGDSIPEWRLVPNDNNIGQRNVFPVAGASGAKGLLASLNGSKLQIKNPHKAAARMIIRTVLPSFLVRLGWGVSFANPGADAFTLRPGEAKTIVLQLKPGDDFTSRDVSQAKDATIRIDTYANGMLVGGMAYQLDPKLRRSPA